MSSPRDGLVRRGSPVTTDAAVIVVAIPALAVSARKAQPAANQEKLDGTRECGLRSGGERCSICA